MKSKSLVNRKVQLAFGSVMVTLLVVSASSYRAMVMSDASDRWVRHTHEVIESLKDMVLATESAKANAGGFVLTGRESYFEAYRANRILAEQDRATVRTLTANNPEQRRLIPELERLAAQQIQLAEMAIDLRQTKGLGPAAEAIRSGQDKRITDGFQGVVREMQAEEVRLLSLRDVDAKRRASQNKRILIFGTLLGLLIAGCRRSERPARQLRTRACRGSTPGKRRKISDAPRRSPGLRDLYDGPAGPGCQLECRRRTNQRLHSRTDYRSELLLLLSSGRYQAGQAGGGTPA